MFKGNARRLARLCPVVRIGIVDPDAKRRPASYPVDGGLCLDALLVESRCPLAIICETLLHENTGEGISFRPTTGEVPAARRR